MIVVTSKGEFVIWNLLEQEKIAELPMDIDTCYQYLALSNKQDCCLISTKDALKYIDLSDKRNPKFVRDF